MSGKKAELSRRNFLKLMGWSAAGSGLAACDLPTTVTLEEGKEEVVAYLAPEEYAIPGIGVWYSSTCLQCPAGCGIHGRVREGRALKIEGNPDSGINQGKTCMMGQSGLQSHYNPNRLTKPLMKKNGSLTEVSWEEANKALAEKVGQSADLGENGVAWLTGNISGHQAVLVNAHLTATNSNRHYAYEVVGAPVWQQVAKSMLGDSNPLLKIAEAKSILTFGADFLGTWQSPVHFAAEYGKFRRGDRGVLMAIEPKMSITGSNADLWLAAKPGSEGIVALAIANELLKNGISVSLPQSVKQAIDAATPAKAREVSGIQEKRIQQIAKTLKERSPSIVLAGAPVENQSQGYSATSAVMLLNYILGNIGATVVPRGTFPFPDMAARSGSTKAFDDFLQAAINKEIKVAFIHGCNPVYSAPLGQNITKAFEQIPFKVQLATQRDETTLMADLVLPMYSALEDWGTHVASYQPQKSFISIQQPLMEPLHSDTRGFGDTLISLLKMRKVAEFEAFADYYAYLRQAFSALPASLKGGADDETFWTNTLQSGIIAVDYPAAQVAVNTQDLDLSNVVSKVEELTLLPSARLGLWDGRHANVPWLQEAPDQISKVVWDSWAEIHPATAAKLNIQQGDLLEIKTDKGAIKVKAVLFRGIHQNAIAVPLGQGHSAEFGQFAGGLGANPLSILNPDKKESKTGELAMYGQSVNVSRSGRADMLVKMGAVDTQQGRRLASVISADQYRRTEGG